MAAAQGPVVVRAYASTTPCGAGANTCPRTACQAAAALNVIDSAQHSSTAATTHCQAHNATTGSRSGQLARASSRGAATAVTKPSRRRTAGTVMGSSL